MKKKQLILSTICVGLFSCGCFLEAQEEASLQDTPPRISRWDMSGGFLYWKPSQDGLEYVLISPSQDIASLNNFIGNKDAPDPHFQWNPGFRMGFGYYPGPCVDIFVNWTHYDSSAKGQITVLDTSSISVRPIRFLALPWLTPLSGSASVESRWGLHYNTVDIEVAAHIHPGSSLAVRSYAGLRGAWIHETYGSLATSIDNSQIRITREKYLFEAGGLRAGLDAAYSLGCGFSLFAKASGSILYGTYKNQANGFYTATFPTPTTLTDLELKLRKVRVRTNLEGAAGLQWEICFCDWYRLSFLAGYEILSWFDQAELQPQFLSDLGMQGFRFDANFNF